MDIRNFLHEDYEAVVELWKKCNISLTASDTKEEIMKFVERNMQTSLVGVKDNKIMGCVLGGYDGRRGLVHHLAVDPDYQKKGYGKELLNELENVFKEMGVIKMSFWVLNSNIDVVNFYEKLGYQVRNDIMTMSKIL